MTITLADTTVQLLAERAMLWPEQQALFVADLHLGKCDHFRSWGLPIPQGITGVTLERLTKIVQQKQAQRIYILGDFWHSRDGLTDECLSEVAAWLKAMAPLTLELIPGNHDRNGLHEIAQLGIIVRESISLLPPFALMHDPVANGLGYAIGGHIHPAISLRSRGRQRLKLPCFWVTPGFTVLPAFGEFTGTAVIQPAAADRVFVVADDEVLAVPR